MSRRARIEGGRAEARAGLAFTTPVMAAVAIFFVVPTLVALALSLTDFDSYALAHLSDLRWVGLGNYRALFADRLFWRAMANTFLFAALGVPASIGASLGAALLLQARGLKWRAGWRVALFVPFVTPMVATAVLWRYVLDTRYGILNRALGALGVAPVDWLGDPRFSIPAITLFVVWRVFGYNMVVFTAALAAVPAELLEAARLDGASAWTRFRHVTLPAIGPTLLLAGLLSVTGFLQIFSEPYVMTRGGPAGATVTLLYFMVDQGFEWWSLGIACAVAVVLFALTVAITAAQVRLGRRYEWV